MVRNGGYHHRIIHLLVRKDELLKFLSVSNLCVVWNIKGEKRLLGRHYQPNDNIYWGENYSKGCYRIGNNSIEGKLNYHIEERNK